MARHEQTYAPPTRQAVFRLGQHQVQHEDRGPERELRGRAEVAGDGRCCNFYWLADTDESVDLALQQVGLSDSMDALTFPSEAFVTGDTFRKFRVNETDDVLFTDLFAAYPGSKRNLPIVRHGKLALVTDERIPVNTRETEKLILAEVTSFGGNSGSPVFFRLGGIREGGPPYQAGIPITS